MKELSTIEVKKVVGGSHCKCSNGAVHPPSMITHQACRKWCCETNGANSYEFASAFTTLMTAKC